MLQRKNIRRNMVREEETIDSLRKMMDTRTVFPCKDLHQRNQSVIEWLRERRAPPDMLERAEELDYSCSDASLAIIEEIVYVGIGEVPKYVLEYLVSNTDRVVMENYLEYCRRQLRKRR